ncbi:MAG: DUF2267 domain-containing protein [Candidatus Levyibacteriota bacterium]
MSINGLAEFDATIQETNALLKDIEAELNWEGERENAYKALKAVLHTLRDRLTVEEAADFAAQLPVLVRGIYYAEWKPEKTPRKMHRSEFLEEIAKEMGVFPVGAADEMLVEDIVRGVLLSLRRYISTGELEDVADMMPEDIKPIIRDII